eukprot:TRINITY_DN14912_c0_g2_i2.p1 TRINITY_DN14912_c0_g2~~TRINITY_DN14912_c0_g2_i2.p1  ORF type:complete len:526 (-),score=64.13 TRINITY_DN14912_c0_g2_i2:124-1701(-)
MQAIIDVWNLVAEGTVLVPVERLDATLESLALPASVDIVKFLLTLVLALPLGFASRLIPKGSPRHLYNLVVGVAFAQACYGPGWLHMFFSSAVAYLMMLCAPRSNSGLWVFVWMMLYIGCTHVYRMWSDWLGYTMDFSGPQMMATIKVTSCAFNYSDGCAGRSEKERKDDVDTMAKSIKALSDKSATINDANEKKALAKEINKLKAKQSQTKLALDDLPNPLEYFGWVHNFSTYQAGPALEIQEYLSVNNGLIELPGGCFLATLRQFVQGVVCLGAHMVFDAKFPLGSAAEGLKNAHGPLSDAFLELDILSRVAYVMVSVFGVQLRFFMAWKLGEAAATAFGYGSNGGKWNGCQNIDLRVWLLSDNMSEASKAWNQKTQAWLQTYTYRRYPGGRGAKLLATYAVSAYWHGFYPGYYITFFNLGLLNMAHDKVKVHIRPYFCGHPGDEKAQNVFESISIQKKAYDAFGIIALTWIKSFVTLPFLLSTVGNAWTCMSRLYFIGVVFTLVGFFIVPLVPKKRKQAKRD